MFRRISWLFLFALLLLQMGGLWTSLKIQQGFHRWEMLERIESDPLHLVTIKMSVQEYKSCLVEHDEIRWHGEMYDIKAETLIGDTIELIAFPDKEEDRILDRLTVLEDKHPLRKNGETYLFALSRLLYLQPTWDFQMFIFVCSVSSEFQYLLNCASPILFSQDYPPEI
jgi:hypothetical protein